MSDEVLEKIKSRGYWQIVIRPTLFSKERLSLPETERQLRACQVSFRGASFPLIKQGAVQIGIDYIEHSFSSPGFAFHEAWRFYQSGQLLLYRSLSEDWAKEAGHDPGFEKGTVLAILSTLYFVSEVFEFSSRLAQQGILAPEGFIQVNLVGIKERRLIFWGGDRALFDTYTCNIGELPRSWTLTGEQIAAEGRDLAFDHFLWIMQRFGYDAKSEVYKPDQEKFFRRQI